MPRKKKEPGTRLQDRVVLRHRSEGHLRFQIPPELATAQAAASLEEGLRAVEGVYRVTVYRGARKLSVRYQETVCGVRDVVLALDARIDRVAATPVQAEPPPRPLKERVESFLRLDGLKAKVEDLKMKAGVAAAVISARGGLPVKMPANMEGLAINFLNDLVAFYLIKVHWNLVTQQWLKQPFKFRNAWLTVFYLVFLMVRYRKAGQAKALPKPKG
ncbi:MAG: hypothetical protein H7841_07205 [Magnetospirillum sp. WYHS-4]